MYNVVDTDKTFDMAAQDLERAVKAHGFGVLHVHNLGETLRSKGIDFNEECKVFEVCNAAQASKVLAVDMRLNMALPCRISVYTDKGTVRIGYVKPTDMLNALSVDPALAQIAAEVEAAMVTMVGAAR